MIAEPKETTLCTNIEVLPAPEEIEKPILEIRYIESRDAGLRLHRSPDVSDTPYAAEIGPADDGKRPARR